MPNRYLSYAKIVQGERKKLVLIAEPQPILCKDKGQKTFLPNIFGVLVISGAKIAVTTVKINLLRWFKSFEEV